MSNTFIQRKKWNQFTTSLIWNKSSMKGCSLKSRPCSQMVFNDIFVLCSCVSNRYDECENQNQTLDLHNKEWVMQGGKGHVTGYPTPDQIRILLILLIPLPHWPPPAMSAISNTKFYDTSLLLLVQLLPFSLHLEYNVTMGSPRASAGKIIHSLYLSILVHQRTI